MKLEASGLVAAWLASCALVGCGGTTVPVDQTGPGGAGGTSGAGGRGGGKGGESTGGTAGAGVAGSSCTEDPSDLDVDRDGYPNTEDCNDFENTVNPGAFDVPANGVDDDCDGTVDNGPGMACDDSADVIPMDTADPVALARSMGLCGQNPARTPIPSWGVWNVELTGMRVPWTPKRSHLQHGVHTEFGGVVSPRQGRTMLMLSTGIARTGSQPMGVNAFPSLASLPVAVAATPELLPTGFPENDPVCIANTPYDDRTAWNPIALQINIRTPTNAVQLKWSAAAVVPKDIDEQVCRGGNHIFAAFKELYDGSSAAVNIATLPDGSPYSVDHLPWTKCRSQSFSVGERLYSFTCAAELPAQARPWWGAATDWTDFVVDVTPGQDLSLTLITWAHGEVDGGPFGVFLDDFQWVASPPSGTECNQ